MILFNSPDMFWYGFVFNTLIFGTLFSAIQCNFFIKFLNIKGRPIHYGLYMAFFCLSLLMDRVLFIAPDISKLLGIPLVYLFIRLIFKQERTVSLLASTLTITINVLVECMVVALSRLPFEFLKTNEARIFANLFILACTYFFLRYFSNKYSISEKSKTPYLFILVSPFLFITVTLSFILEVKYAPSLYNFSEIGLGFGVGDYKFSSIVVLAFICISACLYAFEKTIKYFSAQEEKSLLKRELDTYRSYADEARIRYDLTRAFRHDFNAHLTVLQGLLERKEIKKASEYLLRFQDVSEKLSFSFNTGNTEIDILLGDKLKIAEELGILTECEVIIPSNVKIESFDLCIIFSNALDNAIKSCGNIQENKKFIDIKADTSKDFFIIDMLNSYTVGADISGSGLGLPSMRAVAEKYSGAVETEEQDGIFRLSVLLPFNSEEN